MSYTMLPSPLGGTERLLVTQDIRGLALAASLGARPVRAHNGLFLASRKATVWTRLFDNGVVAQRRSYGWVYRHEYKQYMTLYNVMKHLTRKSRAKKSHENTSSSE